MSAARIDERPRLLFVAPWFLFPTISGGRIRTVDVLRGMKGKRFHITLLQPRPKGGEAQFADELERVCDEAIFWDDDTRRSTFRRVASLASRLPVSVATDRSKTASAAIDAALGARPDVVVVDFVHTAILCPERFEVPSLVFTHNVESEIYARHAERATRAYMRAIWQGQADKMRRFERDMLRRFDRVIAVSDRDAQAFRRDFGIERTRTIPTGVDVDFHQFARLAREGDLRARAPRFVFTGSMNWLPNIEGLEWFLAACWPRILRDCPEAELEVIGRDPDPGLVEAAKKVDAKWHFTGFVDDVRPHIQGGDLSIIPLRIGGGTRLKAYEAMALGSPLVSTTLGVGGLPVEDDVHCAIADGEEGFARACVAMLRDGERRTRLRRDARVFVEENVSSTAVARVFEELCVEAMDERRVRRGA